jgi:hypothetical protein
MCSLEGNKICKTCFGARSKNVIGTRVGGLPAVILANSLSKRIMKSKHFTTTNVMDTTSADIDKYFNVESGKMFIKPNLDIKNLMLVVNREYVEEIAEGNMDIDEEGIEVTLPLESFIIRDLGEDGGDTLIECDGSFLLFTNELLQESSKFIIDFESDDALIPMRVLDRDAPVFNMIVISEEVSRYLNRIERLVNSSTTKSFTDVSEFLHELTKTLIESGANKMPIIHTETLIYPLLRDSTMTYLRPNFKDEIVNYTLLPLSQAILKRDLYTAIAFEKFKAQMIDMDSFVKNGTGIFDPIFTVTKPKYLKPVDNKIIQAVLSTSE